MTLINRIATTAKGWTDNDTCLEWFRRTFIPQASMRRENPEETVILAMDGHESHKTPGMQRLALEHNIEFFFLPPHTTHRLQPLDVGVFGPLQRRWQQRCDEIIGETNGEVPRSQFVKEYMGVRNEIFTEELIQSAWKNAGMWPPNSHKFTEKDFAPSRLMSYTASLPPEYPEVPDMLAFTHERGDDEGVGDRVNGGGEAGDRVGGDGEGAGDRVGGDGEGAGDRFGGDDDGLVSGATDEAMSEGGDEDDERDESGDEDSGRDVRMTRREAESWEDDRILGDDAMNTNDGRNEEVNVGETPEDAVVGGTNTLSNKSRWLRYERNAYHLEQLMLIYPYSPLPAALPTSMNRCDRAWIKHLEDEVRSLHSKLKIVAAHSACAGWEIKSLQQRLNSKGNRANKRKVRVNAHYVSSAEAIRMLDEQERADAEKRQKEEEAQAAKKAKDDQRKQQREAGDITFFGSLNSKTRDDLLDISFALGLTGSDSNTSETKATLITLINAHLDNNPHLASDPTFTGLFLSRNRGRRRNVNDENAAPTPVPPSTLLSPSQPLSDNSSDNASVLESDPPMVLFSEMPGAGRFFNSINSTPPNFDNFPGSSSFPQYHYYPPPIPHPTDPHLPPFYHPPPPTS